MLINYTENFIVNEIKTKTLEWTIKFALKYALILTVAVLYVILLAISAERLRIQELFTKKKRNCFAFCLTQEHPSEILFGIFH